MDGTMEVMRHIFLTSTLKMRNYIHDPAALLSRKEPQVPFE